MRMIDFEKYKDAVFDTCEKHLNCDDEYIKSNNEYLTAERAFKQSLSDSQLKEYLKLESMAVSLSTIEKLQMCSYYFKNNT